MVLNYIWLAFFLLAAVCALVQAAAFGRYEVFNEMMTGTFASAKSAFEISLGLTGVLSLWMGVMKVGERGGAVGWLARWLSPVMSRLFPDIPKGHPATGSIFMNIAANMLGLDNAATPLGLKAMRELQEIHVARHPDKADTASDPMIMFLVLNTSGLTLVPVSIMVYRAELGAANPTDVFVPILLATFAATLAGIVVVSLWQRINLLQPVLLCTLGGLCLLVAAVVWLCSRLDKETMNQWSTLVASVILLGIIIAFLVSAMRRRVNAYEAFIDGAKDGFATAVRIIPYLVAILVAIGLFRASGGMDLLTGAVRWAVGLTGAGTEFVDALPTALMKPLSGSGARGMMVDTMTTFGPDSFAGRLSCIFQGSTDTTFYILAVYFGSVGIRHTRHAVACGLLADLAGILAAIAVAHLFFA